MNQSDLLDELDELDRQKAIAEERVKAIVEEIGALKAQILSTMQEQGLTRLSNGRILVTKVDIVRPRVIDWDVFNKFVLRHKALHLFERRVAAKAYQEMSETVKVPGVEPFTHQSLRITRGKLS